MSALARFRPYMRGEGLILSGGMAALLAATAMKLLEPWPLKFVVDSVLRGQPTSAGAVIGICAAALIAITAFRAVFQFIASTIFSLVGGRILTRVRSDLFAHVQRLSADFHEKSRAGDITLRLVGDVGMLKDTAVTAMLPLMGNVMVLAGMIGVMLWLDWRLALIALVPLPLLWLATRRVGARIGQASRAQRKREGAIAATAGEALAGMRAIQALGLEGTVTRMFASANERSLTDGVRSGRLSAGLERLVDAMVGVATAAILWFGAHAVISGRLSPGELLVFLTYLKNTFRPVREYAKYSGRLAKAAAASDRVFDLLDRVPTVRDRNDARPAPAFRGDIDFRGVDFGYGGDPVLRGLDLHIPAGQRVAITGPSGIGKSTLLTLLLRLRDPDGGTVAVDGTDIGTVTLESLRRQISFVAQEPLLFSTTIAENIALGAGRDVTRAEIVAAARLADADGFIAALPMGYDTQVSERGANFSAGQRQRLAIARAALRHAPLLMMDEPTAGLDSASEDAVARALAKLARGRTTLLVTHNLALAAQMDRVVLLHGGKVAEDGPHDALLAQGGRYAALWRLQQGGRARDAATG
ncbi:ABC transporter ATP-binding protein [Cereibacter sp. SYSU M97828]|nr:ABC transporter ATP-binding protein [Cereibacter flavus]